MKIALLNLPVDNNYGGHLQRYALIKTLQRLGHNVIHLNLITKAMLPWYKLPYSFIKRIVLKYIYNKKTTIFYEREVNKTNKTNRNLCDRFYNDYIPHTRPLYTINDIKKTNKDNYDVYLVGSDQVWRKAMTQQIGLYNYFFKFLGNKVVKRIGYSISLGNDINELSAKEIKKLTPFYKKFDAISVRELSALNLFKQYNWSLPQAKITLDPTLLLEKNDYIELINQSKTNAYTKGKIYSYILDYNNQVLEFIKKEAKNRNLEYIIEGLNNSINVSIEQWLCNINNAQFIITDSYHGTVFSLIFKKPFIFIGNNKRGNTRVESLFTLLDITNKDTLNLDWPIITKNLDKQKINSIQFLKSIDNNNIYD